MVSRMNRARTLLLAGSSLALLFLCAPPLAGQIDEPVRPPKVEQPAKAPRWLYYIVGVGAMAVCVGLAVFPSRRTHED